MSEKRYVSDEESKGEYATEIAKHYGFGKYKKTPIEEVTMGYLLSIIGEAVVQHKGLMTWEQGLRAIRKYCSIYQTDSEGRS